RRRRLHLSVRCGDKQKPRGDQHHGSGTACEDLHRLPPARCDRLRKEREYSAACKRHPQGAVPGHRAIEARHEHMSCSAGTIVRRGELDNAWPHQPRLKETALGEQCLEPGSDGGVGPAADVRPLWPKLHRVTSPSTSGPSTRRRTACCVSSWTSTARWSSASIRISGCCTAGPRS